MFRSKKNYLNIFIYLFLLFCLIIIILFKTPGLKGSLDQELRILTKEPLIIKKRYPLKKNLSNIKIALRDLLTFKKKKFDTLTIDMKFKDFDKLKKDRSKSLKNGLLENPTKINLNLRWKKKKISSSGRLKGDFNDHRNFNKQWSLKLNLKKSENIDGMTEFSITNHQSRNFPYNFIISKNLERMGLDVSKFKTVKVNFNGYDWGLMLMEEHFSKEFLENRKLKNNVIFRLSDEQKMMFRELYLKNEILELTEYEILTKWQDGFSVNYQNKKKIFKKKQSIETKDFLKKITLMKSLNEKINIDSENLNDEIVEKYFDLKSFSIMLVSSLAWGERNLHSMTLNNARFYINPYTLKITPIPSDFDFIFKNNNKILNSLNNKDFLEVTAKEMLTLPTIYSIIFKNDKFKKFYLQALNEFEKNLENIINDTRDICSDYNEICTNSVKLDQLKKNVEQLQAVKKKIFEVYLIEQNKIRKLDDNKYNKYIKESNLNKIEYFDMYKKHIYARVYDDGNLNLINLTSTNLYIDSIEIDEINYKKKINLEIQGSGFNEIKNLKIDLNIRPKLNSVVKLNYSFKKNETQKNYETSVEKNINLIETDIKFYDIKKNKILIKGNDIIFENKKFIIDKPLIVPENYNLIILDGANLLFSKNAYILINNGSLKILGKSKNKVNISALKNEWGGIHVIGNNNNSEINHAIISQLNHFETDKFTLTGGINFYKSNVKINNSIFNESNSEDFINFVKSNFYINNSFFSKTRSDAIDSDYSIGKIENTKFIDIGGDAIDTSGSNVTINKTEIFNVGDKGISAGEKSFVNVSNVLIDNSKIGIASKDSSEVLGSDILINNSRSYDLASYNKKKIFKGGIMNLTKVVSGNKYLSQKNSIIKINNKKIIEKNFKTKDLY